MTWTTHLREVSGQDAALVVESRALHTLEQLEEILGGTAQAFRTVGDATGATTSAATWLLLLCVGHEGMLASVNEENKKQETG